MARDHGETLGELAVSERHTRKRWGCGRRGDPWNHLHRDACGCAGLPFLTPTAEDEGVSTLEAYDRLAGGGVVDQDLVDPLLGGGGAPWDLGDFDDHCFRSRVLQGGQRRQPITNNHVRLFDGLQSGDGQQTRVSRAAADQDHRSGTCGLLDRCWRRGHSRHTVLTSSRGNHLITLRQAGRRYYQCRAQEVVRRRRAAAHDQQSARREIGDSRPDLRGNDRQHGARVQQLPDGRQGRRSTAAHQHR